MIFAKLEDFSVLHGVPDQMRKDKVNPGIIQLVQEEIYYLNYLLIQAHRELGLIINADHPQLRFPDGYDREEFVRNFINIIKHWWSGASREFQSLGAKLLTFSLQSKCQISQLHR